MTRAAEQCREYIEAKWPGTPIGRFSCRDTASGYISQHSAYNGYDSNALDIWGPNKSGDPIDTAWVQAIVDDLTPNLEAWSGRKILWQIPLHYEHAHIDFYPMCLEHKWCGRNIVPEWEYSDNSTVASIDPDPENGEYHGEEGTMPEAQWFQMIDALFAGRPDEFQGDPEYWKHQVPTDSAEWSDFWAAFVRAISPREEGTY